MKKWQRVVALFTCLSVLVAFSCSDIATKVGADDSFSGKGIDISSALNNMIDLDTSADYYVFKAEGNGLYTVNFKGNNDMKNLRFNLYDATDKHDLVSFNMEWGPKPETSESEYMCEYNLTFEGEKGKTYYMSMVDAPDGMKKVVISGVEGVEKQEYVEGEPVYIPAGKFGTVSYKPKKTSVYIPKMNVGKINVVEYDFNSVLTEDNGDEVTTTTVAVLPNTGKFGYTFIKGKTYQLKLVNESDKTMEFTLEDETEKLLEVPVADLYIEKNAQATYSVAVKEDTVAAFAYDFDEDVVFDVYAYNQERDCYFSILDSDDVEIMYDPDDVDEILQYNISMKKNTNYYITISSLVDETIGDLDAKGDGFELVEVKESNSRPIIIPPKKQTTTVAPVTTAASAATTAVPPAAVNTFPKLGELLVDTKTKATYKVTMVGQEVEFVKPKNKSIKSITIPATVTINGVTYKVTSIKANCFKGYKKLAKVTIGKNVKKIGKQAFYNCKKLKTIIFKTKLLKSSKVGAKAFGKIHKKAVAKIPKKQLKAYKKFLKKKGMNGKKQKFKKA